jgi:hypothetical protein
MRPTELVSYTLNVVNAAQLSQKILVEKYGSPLVIRLACIAELRSEWVRASP